MEHVIVFKNGSQFFYKGDKYHRSEKDEHGELLPAIQFSNGHKEWWIEGKQIRVSVSTKEWIWHYTPLFGNIENGMVIIPRPPPPPQKFY